MGRIARMLGLDDESSTPDDEGNIVCSRCGESFELDEGDGAFFPTSNPHYFVCWDCLSEDEHKEHYDEYSDGEDDDEGDPGGV